MNKEQLIKIAKAGFPERVQQFINFDNCEMFHHSSIYRLYDKNTEFMQIFPREDHLSIFIGANNFIQITCGIKAFNHYAAIKEMESLGLV